MRAPNDVALSPLRFLEWASRVFPNRPGIVYGDRTLTYGEMADEAEKLAGALRTRIQPGDRVAFLAPNVPELLIAHFAIPLAGGVLVALNTRLAPAEIAYILDHSGSRIAFADTALIDQIDPASVEEVVETSDPTSGLEPRGIATSYQDFLGTGDRAGVSWQIEDENSLISLNYTSGTTGRPKGVMYTHRGAYLNALGVARHIGYDRATRYLWTLPMFHCNGWCATWGVTAVAGLHVCLRAVTGEGIWSSIDRWDVNHMSGAPAVLATLAGAPQARPVDRPLRVTTGGAPPSPSIIGRLEGLGMTVVHAYGLTEVYGPFTICEPQDSWADLPLEERARLMARQGVPMVQSDEMRIVDQEMNPLPADGESVGEVVMRGSNVTVGYFRDPDATAEAFRGGWFHSGDLAVMHPDGYLELKDRAKDIIISGGENISSIEVENALMALPEIDDAAVVGVADQKWGERPIAFVVTSDSAEFDPQYLKERLSESIARFKIPDRYHVVDELPRTSTGKVRKHELRARAAAEEGHP